LRSLENVSGIQRPNTRGSVPGGRKLALVTQKTGDLAPDDRKLAPSPTTNVKNMKNNIKSHENPFPTHANNQNMLPNLPNIYWT